MGRRLLAPVLVLALALSLAREVRVDVPAVGPEGAGVLVRMAVSASPGGGVAVAPAEALGNETLASARAAVEAVRSLSPVNPAAFSISFSFDPAGPVVDGPSAGLAMAVALSAALEGWSPREGLYITGGVLPNGTALPVGGAFPKAKAVAVAGGEVLLVPTGQSFQVERLRTAGGRTVEAPLDLASYAAEHWGLAVVEVAGLAEAVAVANGTASPPSLNRSAAPEPALSLSSGDPLRDLALHLVAITDARLAELEPRLPPEVGGQPLAPRAEAIRRMSASALERLAAGSAYLAANDAFQAEVDSDLLGRLVAHAASSEPDALVRAWRVDAEVELERAKGSVPVELVADAGALEWVLAAQLRCGWAEAMLATAGDGPLESARAAAAVHAWSVAARDLGAIARERASNSTVRLDNSTLPALTRRVQGRLAGQVALGHALGADLRGAEAHMVSSPLLAEEGWHLAALADASLGLARVESSVANRSAADAEAGLLEAELGAARGNLTDAWARALLQASRDSEDAGEAFLCARTGRLLLALPRAAAGGREPAADLLAPRPELPEEFHRRAWGRLGRELENATELPPVDMGRREDWWRALALVGLVLAALVALWRLRPEARAERAPAPSDVKEARRRAAASALEALERCRAEGVIDRATMERLGSELSGGPPGRGA